MFDFKVGQRVVWKSDDGCIYGIVTDVYDEDYPVVVKFCNDIQSFTSCGRYHRLHGFVSLFPFRGVSESRRIVAMLAREYRKWKKEHAKTDAICGDITDFITTSQLEARFKDAYLKAKSMLNEANIND